MAQEKEKQGADSFDSAQQAKESLESAIGDIASTEDVIRLDTGVKKQDEAAIASDLEVEKTMPSAPLPPAEPREVRHTSDRQQIRVLMIMDDPLVFVEGSTVHEEYRRYALLFDELHVIVLTSKDDEYTEPVRVNDTFWLYPSRSGNWLFSIYRAYRTGVSQLSFASGFRADIIATRNPFEAGLAGYFLARRFSRTLQIHVHTNPFDPYFQEQSAKNWFLVFIAWFILPRANCIRVTSEYLKNALTKRFGDRLRRLIVLPVFHDLGLWFHSQPRFSLKDIYPQFKFIMLIVAEMHPRQNIELAIDAASYVLSKYPIVGLVIVGEGSHRKTLERKVASMKMQDYIKFEPHVDDTVSYMKSADLFLNTADFDENDEVLAQAAAAGVPIISTSGGLADALIEDGKSGFLCPKNDVTCFGTRINEFLNNNRYRKMFSTNVRDRVFSIVEQDPNEYYWRYAQSFVQCVVDSYEGG